jgi:hypothetical protein
MKTKRVAVFAVIAMLILMAVLFMRGPGTVPAGQQPLLALSTTNLREFERAFEASENAPRLLLLVSPT